MFKNKFLSFIFFISLIILLTLNSKIVVDSVKSSLFICYNSVIPSLFVFMVLSSLIASSNSLHIFAIFFKPYMHLLKLKSKEASCYFFLSIFSGFAMGSIFLNDLYFKNYNKNSLKILSILFCQNSFSFIILFVGVNILNNISLAFIIFLSLFSSSVITAFIFSFFIKYDYQNFDINLKVKKQHFSQIIEKNVVSILNICGVIIIFYLICDFLNFYISNEDLKAFIFPFMEVTTSILNLSTSKNPYLIAFSLSVYPLSTLSQISFFTNNKVDIKFLLFSRILHTPLALLILNILLNLFPYINSAYASSSDVFKTHWITADMSVVLFLISFFFILFLEENKRFTISK